MFNFREIADFAILGQPPSAAMYFLMLARVEFNKANDPAMAASIDSNLAILYAQTGRCPDAKRLLADAESLFVKIGNMEGLAAVQTNKSMMMNLCD